MVGDWNPRIKREKQGKFEAPPMTSEPSPATPADACTCLTELQDDAYSPGGPMSGKQKPPPCKLHNTPADASMLDDLTTASMSSNFELRVEVPNTDEDLVVTHLDEALAHEIVKGADIVTQDGYYEVDIESISKILARHRIGAATELQSLRAEVKLLLEYDAAKAAAIDNSLNQLGAQEEELQSLREKLRVAEEGYRKQICEYENSREDAADVVHEMATVARDTLATIRSADNG